MRHSHSSFADPLVVLERVPHRIAVPLLLAAFAVFALFSLRGDAVTWDETAHIAAGYTYLDRWDFRLNPEHPPLAKLWAALPLWLSGRGDPDYGSAYWTGADQWRFGFEFLNGPIASPARRNPDRILFPARSAMLCFGIALGVAVYFWSRRIWGPVAALVSLFLFACSPPMLAHARLVTTDMPAALGFVLAVWAYLAYLQRPSTARAAISGLALGAALLVKFSTLLLGPILLLVAATWTFWPRAEGSSLRSRAVKAAAGLVAAGLVAWLVLWAGYGFRYAGSAEPGHALDWSALLGGKYTSPAPIALARELHLLPEAYIYGFEYARTAETRLGFLNGEISEVGWYSYFPIAFGLKTPPAFTALVAWILIAAAASASLRHRLPLWLVLLPPLAYFAFSIQARLNIGHRHLVPMYPFLFVACGGIVEVSRDRLRRWIFVALLGGCAVSFAAATPRYLAYFNVLGGGSRDGWRHLLDSNIDWGQDLKRLAEWVRARKLTSIDLAYFGTGDPNAYGIPYRKVFIAADFRPDEPSVQPQSGDLLAISVNFLQGLYLDDNRRLAEEVWKRGWLPMATIREWGVLRAESIRERQRPPDFGPWAVERRLLTEEQVREAEAGLLPAWIRHLRDTAAPIARVGDSIFIYRVP